jgi:TPR repeat protein
MPQAAPAPEAAAPAAPTVNEVAPGLAPAQDAAPAPAPAPAPEAPHATTPPADSQFNLGVLAEHGLGMPKNLTEAYE